MPRPMKPTITRQSKDLFFQAQRLRELARIERQAEHQIAKQYKAQLIAHVAETLSNDPFGRMYSRSGAAEIGINYSQLFEGLRFSRAATPDQIGKADQAAKLAYQIGGLAAQLKDLKADLFKAAHHNDGLLYLLTEAATLRPQGDRYEDQN